MKNMVFLTVKEFSQIITSAPREITFNFSLHTDGGVVFGAIKRFEFAKCSDIHTCIEELSDYNSSYGGDGIFCVDVTDENREYFVTVIKE